MARVYSSKPVHLGSEDGIITVWCHVNDSNFDWRFLCKIIWQFCSTVMGGNQWYRGQLFYWQLYRHILLYYVCYMYSCANLFEMKNFKIHDR